MSATSIDSKLKQRGVFVSVSWVQEVLSFLNQQGNSAPSVDDVFQQFLYSDLRNCGLGCAPKNLSDKHKFTLAGPYVFQVNEIFNAGEALESRQEESSSRNLKLALTDGKQIFHGFEYKRLPPDIHINSKPGLKVFKKKNIFKISSSS